MTKAQKSIKESLKKPTLSLKEKRTVRKAKKESKDNPAPFMTPQR
jgi:hypothetical protein